MLEHVTQAVAPPGSTFKLVTAATTDQVFGSMGRQFPNGARRREAAPVGNWPAETPWTWSAAAVTSLNVEPGGATACVTCSSIGEPGRPARACSAPPSTGGPYTLLSNDGVLAMASTWPFRGSIATAAPILPLGRGCAPTEALMPASSRRCRPRSMDSRRSAPRTGGRSSPRVTGTPVGADVQALPPVDPAQDRVVLLLEPGPADELPRRQARPALLVLGGGHADEAEHRSEERALRVRAARLRDDEHAPDRGGGDRVGDRARHVGHRQRQRRRLRGGELRVQVRGRAADEHGEPARRRRAARSGATGRRGRGPRRCRRPPRPGPAGRRAGR